MKSFTYLASAVFLFAAVPTSATFGLQETTPDKMLQSFEGDWVVDTVATKFYWKEQQAAGTFEMPPSLQQESESTKEHYLKNGSNVSASHVCFSLRDGKATINAVPSSIEVFKKPQKSCRVSPSEANLPGYKFCWKDKQLICNLLPDKDINSSDHRIGPFVMQKLTRRPIPKRFHGTWVLDKQATKKRWKNMVTDGLISRTTSLVNKLFDAKRLRILKFGISQSNADDERVIAWNHRVSRNRIFAKFRSDEDLELQFTDEFKLIVHHKGHFRLPRIFRLETTAEKKLREASREKEMEIDKLDAETPIVDDASSADLEYTEDSVEIVQVPDALIGEWVPDIVETKRYLRDQFKLGIMEPEHAAFFVDVLESYAFHIHLGKERSFFEHTKNGKRTEIKNFLIEYGMVHLDSLHAMHLADDLFLVDIGMFYTWVVFKKLKPSETRLKIPAVLRSTWQFNPQKTRELWKQLVADEKLTQTYFDLKWDQIESQFRDIRFSKYELSITLNRLLKEQEQILRPLHVNSISKKNVEITFVGNEKIQTKFNSKNEIQVAWKDNVAAPLIYDRVDLQMLSTPKEFIRDWELDAARSLKLQAASDIDVKRRDEEESFFDKLVALQIDGEKSNIKISSDSVKLESQNCTFDVFSISRARNGMFIGVHCKTLDLGPELIRMEIENFEGKRMIVASENTDLRFVFNRTSKISAQVRPRIPAGIIGQWKFDKTASQKLCSDLIKDGSLSYVPYTKLDALWLDVQGNVPLLLHKIGYPYWMQHMDNTELSIDSTTLTTN